ncbi:hypothetical protein NC653_018237 [Populus alba x Populus x berolinensis]|uniref:Transmembrane protein n=1 Tax=Populus alba x Populus x berolinensis TaxID=444605 RepID=A0AAD6QFY8_9ROSI|nr:hypothetical protein NC653_018232 [Populus alba x Populus x berolinensis]KAJ6989682.1 hypothetical protein NC653_018237 [Populus alba x Populus x berolinensis]
MEEDKLNPRLSKKATLPLSPFSFAINGVGFRCGDSEFLKKLRDGFLGFSKVGFLLTGVWYWVIVVVVVLAFGGALVSKELDSLWERKEREFTRELDFGVEGRKGELFPAKSLSSLSFDKTSVPRSGLSFRLSSAHWSASFA